jgi:putative PIN family toxin of toxin-antitoxin system
LSPAVEAEIYEVLSRPKFASHITDKDRIEILTLIADAAVRIEPRITVTDCRDQKDNKYLELAVSVSAELIISGDRDLLDLDPWRGIRILTPRGYLDLSGEN